MSPVSRDLAGDVLTFRLAHELEELKRQLGTEHTRIGHTLIKEGPLRVTLVGLARGGALHEHVTEGALTIHVVEGAMSVDAGGVSRKLVAGELIALNGGVRHSVGSSEGAVFLLTIAAPSGSESAPQR